MKRIMFTVLVILLTTLIYLTIVGFLIDLICFINNETPFYKGLCRAISKKQRPVFRIIQNYDKSYSVQINRLLFWENASSFYWNLPEWDDNSQILINCITEELDKWDQSQEVKKYKPKVIKTYVDTKLHRALQGKKDA